MPQPGPAVPLIGSSDGSARALASAVGDAAADVGSADGAPEADAAGLSEGAAALATATAFDAAGETGGVSAAGLQAAARMMTEAAVRTSRRGGWAFTDRIPLAGSWAAVGRATGSGCDGSYHPVMLLAVDIGNTNVTTGLFRNGALIERRRATTHARASADELEHLLDALLRLDDASFADVSSIVACSVVPSLTAALEEVAARRERPLLIASAGTVPVAVRTDRPADVGADRLVNALAAARIHGTPAIVADFGTATTLDCVGADGAFVGGAIAPGLELGLDALAARTAKLPRVELRAPDRAIGRDTVSAIQSGTVLGYQALANGLIARCRAELAEASGSTPGDVRVILTGGLSAAPWARGLDGVDAIDPDLTLKGLAILHAEVGGGQPLELGLPR
ncbi:MAG: type III pantothenate kinase [Chloroflexi bacterium]|nr:MAG: type III pantothenate kinase [Chloroflexota bacterium]